MSKLIMLKGLPASGKSTHARSLVEIGYHRVNRDLIREMLHFSEFRDEGMVVGVEKFIVRGYLGKGDNVVVDDCNLNPDNEDMWREIARQYNAEFEVMHIDTGVQECITRDRLREKQVGDHVIANMALQYGLVNIANKVVICDIDGTIADISHRQHHVSGGKKDWGAFFKDFHKDVLRLDVHEMLKREVSAGALIIFVSARPETYRVETDYWLKNRLPYYSGFLLMRPENDKRDDTIVKKNIYEKYLKNLNIVRVYDDRPKVIRMWQGLGLEVVDVGNGIEF